MSKEMLINVSEGEECRIALVENGRLEELYMERTSATSHVGNIYKGRVTNVEPSIQAAFIDFGLGRNGFLHISDLMPTYFGRDGSDFQETVGRKMARKDRPPIQRCLRRGDEIIVQIIKEGIGTKGPTLTSYISIPGRILVMMPGMGKMGVSKKIEDDEERRRLRTILDGLKPPKGVAFIIRTAGIGKTKTEIERDLKYLTRLWETIEKKQKEPGPVELYTEGDLVTRTVRDVFTSDVERIVIDSKEVAKRVKDVIKITAPRTKNKVDVYEESVPLFHQYGIEKDIELMYSRTVPLPSGGSLVIDSTEAIVAIDVNSGRNRDHGDAETTAFRVDMEAADEICRQLKLRDLGGVIICDFIDLRYERHRRELEKRLDDNFRRDRAKTKVLRMSQFGIIEMTRQRMRPSLKRSVYFDCPHCKGAGLVKTPESMALDVMRKLAIAASDLKVTRVELAVCPDVAFFLLNKKRRQIAELEDHAGKKILIKSDQGLGLDELRLSLFDARDVAVILEELGMTLPQAGHVSQLGARPGRNDGRRGGRRGGGGGGRYQGGASQSPPARAAMADDDEDEDARFARETAEEAQETDGGAGDGDGEGEQDAPVSTRPAARQPAREDDRDEPEAAEETEAGDDDASDGDAAEGDAPNGGVSATEGPNETGEQQPGEGGGRRRRRRRRGRRGGANDGGAEGNPPQAPVPGGQNAPRQPRDAARSGGSGGGSGQGGGRGGQNRGSGGGGGGGGRNDNRNDNSVPAYDRGRRADGSFENVTELETVDFGDDDDEPSEPQPLSNESRNDNRRGDNRGGGGRGNANRGGGGRGDNRNRNDANRSGGGGRGDGGRRGGQQPPTRIPPKPQPVVNEGTGPGDEDVLHEAGDANGNQVPTGEGVEGAPLAEGEQPRKRRRRRGGRRHRRRRENQMAREGVTPGLEPPSPNDGGEFIASADDMEDDAEEGDGGEEERQDAMTTGERDQAADDDGDERDEAEVDETPAPVVRAKAPAQDRNSSTSRASRVRRPSPPPAPLAVVKTGSTDKHLVDEPATEEEEIEVDAVDEVTEVETPAPARLRAPSRRPGSFRDLDAIPDDYD